MQNAWIWIVVVVVLLGGGFIWWQSMSPGTSAELTPDVTAVTPPSTPPATGTDATAPASLGMSVAVTYGASGFTPNVVTVKKGGTVTWTQEGGSTMWVATGPHPAHTGYDSTGRAAHCEPGYSGAKPFDECAPSATYSFTFDKVGAWPYHDHMDATKFGRVIVSE